MECLDCAISLIAFSYSNPHKKTRSAWNWLHCNGRSSFFAASYCLWADSMLFYRKEVELLISSPVWRIPQQWSPLLLQWLSSARWLHVLQLRYLPTLVLSLFLLLLFPFAICEKLYDFMCQKMTLLFLWPFFFFFLSSPFSFPLCFILISHANLWWCKWVSLASL